MVRPTQSNRLELMQIHQHAIALLLITFGLIVADGSAVASMSPAFKSDAVEARLVTVQNGIPEDAETLSAALHLKLEPGWKTYWRSPGEVGIAPSIDWSGSLNVSDVNFFWPAPTRFRAFGIENFGYEKEVAFPLQIVLADPGAPVAMRAKVNLLVCSTICVPKTFELALTLGPDDGIDTEVAELLGIYTSRIPDDGVKSKFTFESAAFSQDKSLLTITARAGEAFRSPDIFPEMGKGASFGAPDIRLGDDGRLLWARLVVLAPPNEDADLTITLVDGERAATMPAQLSQEETPPPYLRAGSSRGFAVTVGIVFAAFLGGLILNAMPCVLPVLSIKLNSVIKAGSQSRQRVRGGFLMSAAGVLVFMWLLAGVLIGAKAAGVSVGWGLQFQNPVFLAVMIAILTVFAANLVGLFEITIPAGIQKMLARGGDSDGYAGDFATGAFAAVLATPCSAPFLGTAVAFALTGSPATVLLIFSALGVGLALPYILIAAMPSLVRAIPKPGPWMMAIKAVLGLALAGTVVWLIWVLVGVASTPIAAIVVGVVSLAVAMLSMGQRVLPHAVRSTGLVAVAAAIIAVPLSFSPVGKASNGGETREVNADQLVSWRPFERASVGRLVSEGKTVFVDVTADWCITCKANKALVLERESVAEVLNEPDVIAMVADWTRPDEKIARYLQSHDRFGIPFNIVYGPNAPEGIVLGEILTVSDVLNALDRARAAPSRTVEKP